MPGTRRGRVLLLATLAAVACAGRRGPARAVRPVEPGEVAVYRATWSEGAERERRFRLALFAAAPDRLHAEATSPVGTTEFILDAGGGRLALTVVDERLCYAGPAEPEALERVVGFRMPLDRLVAGLLGLAEPPPGIEIRRSGPLGSLPTRFSVRSGERRLTGTLRRSAPLPEGSRAGSGDPPAGVTVVPLGRFRPGSGTLLGGGEAGSS